MFEDLMYRFTEERNKLVDNCTQKLIEHTGLVVPVNPTNFDLLMLMDDLKRKNYRIRLEVGHNCKDSISLIKIGDMEELLVVGYQFDVRTDDNRVSIVAIPIGNINYNDDDTWGEV